MAIHDSNSIEKALEDFAPLSKKALMARAAAEDLVERVIVPTAIQHMSDKTADRQSISLRITMDGEAIRIGFSTATGDVSKLLSATGLVTQCLTQTRQTLEHMGIETRTIGQEIICPADDFLKAYAKLGRDESKKWAEQVKATHPGSLSDSWYNLTGDENDQQQSTGISTR